MKKLIATCAFMALIAPSIAAAQVQDHAGSTFVPRRYVRKPYSQRSVQDHTERRTHRTGRRIQQQENKTAEVLPKVVRKRHGGQTGRAMAPNVRRSRRWTRLSRATTEGRLKGYKITDLNRRTQTLLRRLRR